MATLYLYLARRDKKGVKILTEFPASQNFPATRVTDLLSLNLPGTISAQIADAVHEHRMFWEPWLESADNFVDLRDKLRARGYNQLPIHAAAMYPDIPVPVAKEKVSQPALRLPTTPTYRTMMKRG
jgi:hypothetical protein